MFVKFFIHRPVFATVCSLLIILAGALILEQVMSSFSIDELTVSSFALREGVLLDTLQRTTGGTLHHLRDVSRRSVLALMEACDEEPAHAREVARIAVELFNATLFLHGLSEDCREYLEAAALLANVGLFVSHAKHHLHSYYVIRNSDRLVGFTDAEIEMIAVIARYHRKSAPKSSHLEFTSLDAGSQQLVRVLASLLRIAIGLDRSHNSLIESVRAHTAAETLVINAVPVAGANADLEIYSANERAGLLASVFGGPVRILAGR